MKLKKRRSAKRIREQKNFEEGNFKRKDSRFKKKAPEIESLDKDRWYPEAPSPLVTKSKWKRIY